MEGEIRDVKKAKAEDKSARQQQPGSSLVGLSGLIMRWTAWYIGRYGSKPIDLKFVSHMTSRMPEVCDAIRVQHAPPKKAKHQWAPSAGAGACRLQSWLGNIPCWAIFIPESPSLNCRALQSTLCTILHASEA